MRLIAGGLVDREGVVGLARRLGYTERHVHRQLVAVVGAGPLALARAQRAQTARILIETTELPIVQVTFAAGFHSVRQFNATIQEVFALTPSQLRARARRYGRLEDLRDLGAAMQRSRALLDLDSDPDSVTEVLAPCARCSVSRSPCAAPRRSPAV
jgi:AraC-like DNA-binding protein